MERWREKKKKRDGGREERRDGVKGKGEKEGNREKEEKVVEIV